MMDCVQVPRTLWAQIYWALELYGFEGNWSEYQHKRAGVFPAAALMDQGKLARQALEAIPPALFEATLLPEPTVEN